MTAVLAMIVDALDRLLGLIDTNPVAGKTIALVTIPTAVAHLLPIMAI